MKGGTNSEKKEKNRGNAVDMTSGPIVGPLIRFILPLIGGGVFQQLYNTVDFIFIGNVLNKTSAAAVGAGSTLIYCSIGLFSGISVGTSVVTAQAVGANNRERTEKALHTSVAFSLWGGIAMMAAGLLLAPLILEGLRTPETAMPEAVLYFRVYMLSVPAMILYNTCSGALRAIGDSKTPFHILVFCGFVNVAMDAFFLLVVPWGVAGVAAATLISQGLSAVLILFALKKKGGPLRLEAKKIAVDRRVLKDILRIGLPTGIQTVFITFSNIIVQYHINFFGETAVAAFAAYYKAENFIYLPILAFGQAATTFAGQNAGAGELARIRRGSHIIAALCVFITAAVAGGILLFPDTVFRWFIKDGSVIADAVLIASVSFPFYWLNAFVEVYGGAVRGMGYALTPMVIVITCICLFRVVLLSVFAKTVYTLEAVASVYPLSWGAAALFLTVTFIVVLRKNIAARSAKSAQSISK